MLEESPIPADVEAETNLPAGDGGDGTCSVFRIDEHRARLKETDAERKKLGRAYRRLAAAAWDDHQRETAAGVELRDRELAPLLKAVHFAGGVEVLEDSDEGRELAARVLGVENRLDRIDKAAAHALRKRDQYAKAAESVVACGEGLLTGQADGDECMWYGVGGCNRIGCPHCSAKRASVEVGHYAPKLADLTDVQVWMLSARNVRTGELADGVRELSEAFGRLVRRRWFKDRWNAGIRSLEVTAGRPPKILGGGQTERRGWHPHFHVIVGNMVRPDDWTHPDGEWDQREIGRYKRRLALEWKAALGVDYEPIVWIDRPHYVDRKTGAKVYADDITQESALRFGHDRNKAFESATREALKYITKGVSEIPQGMLPELLAAKERKRWMQSFGELHEQGVRHCPKCERRWRLKDDGPACAACGTAGVKESELAEEPWCCEHGHELKVTGFITPDWSEWAALNPVGLLLRKRRPKGTGPPKGKSP